jgi:RHS repeat-associated protein
MDRYFYHPDHLVSSSWITDRNGNAIQHLMYLPFGEDWIQQKTTSWFAPYTFSGKEKDTETGYSYFGARYYDSGLSIWLSVDPMSDKYPSMSPYNYCANNPVILVDPDGRDVYTFDENGKILSHDDKQKGYDQVIVQKADGSTVEGEKYEYGTFAEVKEPTYNGKICTQINFKKEFENKRQDVFEFLAKNSQVEWGTIRAEGLPNYYFGCIGTSRDAPGLGNQPESCTSHIVSTLYYNENITILNWDHSHPSGLTIGIPSGYDSSGFPLRDGDYAVAVRYQNIQQMRVFDVKEDQYYLFNAATFMKTSR